MNISPVAILGTFSGLIGLSEHYHNSKSRFKNRDKKLS
jgi:hypothetical protein